MNPFRPSAGQSVIYDADPSEYHTLGKSIPRGDKAFVMSRTELMRFNENPWEWLRGSEVRETGDMAWGSLLDAMFTTPHLVQKLYDTYPETYPAKTKGGGTEPKPWNLNADYCKEWRDERLSQGITPIKMETYEGARQACCRLTEDAHISRLLSVSKRQVMVLVEYVDAVTKIVVPFRMLLDLVPNPEDKEYGNLLGDLKSSNDISIYEWEKNVFYRQYHVQSALYLHGMNAALEREQYTGFLHVLSKSDEPYAIGRRMLSEEFIQLGEDTYKRALARYCRCLAENSFPGVDDEDNVPGSPILDGWRLANPSSYMIA